MMVRAVLPFLLVAFAGLSPARASERIVRAAPVQGDREWSPRRLFNTALAAEEEGNATRAVQLYLAARLVERHSFADELYARGSALRLVRVLSSYDDEAASAAALWLRRESRDRALTDLAPLIRLLLQRLESSTGGYEVLVGTIASIRFREETGHAIIEMVTADDAQRLIRADAVVGPFSAGDPVRVLVRRDSTHALAEHRLVAMGHAAADGWQLIAARGLPGAPGPAYGALLHH